MENFELQNRRYIGSKYKLVDWIFSIIQEECQGTSFADVFAGTGIVAQAASRLKYRDIVVNDFLYSSQVIYRAFFATGAYDLDTLQRSQDAFNGLNPTDLAASHFSQNYGGRYFSDDSARVISQIRKTIEQDKPKLTEHEYYILLASLIYSSDKIANTVGHYDSYIQSSSVTDAFVFRLIEPRPIPGIQIFQEDANQLVRSITSDIVYIDPPYNSRQYSRFYHVLETLAKGDEPELFGVALKPAPENMSEYSRSKAPAAFADLIEHIQARFIVVSYNNTYQSKSSSSENKISLEQIAAILETRGKLKIFDKNHKHFNAGNTDFNDHREFLFVLEVD